MKITLEGLGKHYNKHWLFRNLNYDFEAGKSYAIRGPNGSGKSTFLKLISGYITPSEGQINWHINGKKRDAEELFSFHTFAAPYTLLPEEFKVGEILDWYFGFKQISSGYSTKDLISIGSFESHQNKIIKNFSSGMKQRLKLLLAFYTNSRLLLLDEPCSNLDAENSQWYKKHVETILTGKSVIIASNQKNEYDFCQKILDLGMSNREVRGF